MHPFWVFWALALGCILAATIKNTSAPMQRSDLIRVLAFMFAACGIPVITMAVWPPVGDDLIAPVMLLGAEECLLMMIFGYLAITGARFAIAKLRQKRVAK